MAWRKWLTAGGVTDEEYRANLNGMNTFFGAVIGFVMADVKTQSALEFAQLLFFTACIVVCILYISASSRRWIYAPLTLLFILGLPRMLSEPDAGTDRLQVTLAVWTLLSIALELTIAWTRRIDPPKPPA